MPSLRDRFDAVVFRWNEEEHCLLAVMAEAEDAADDNLNVAALLETARRELRESRELVAGLVEQADRG